MDNLAYRPLEMWGGVECTFNRVGETYFNQCEKNGHNHRLSDLDLFAGLGIKAIRYPVIWEAMAPHRPDQIDWAFTDERLNRLRELGIRPIADLVHHGSGPRYAEITSPQFATGLADFARRVAERYPWLDAYTPVNEPLTTARFSGLYGFWFPHGRDNHIFIRTLLNECKGVSLAMQAIREINPKAQLIQTDDLGRIFSTPELADEAEFQNERRWLGFDLVCGRIGTKHPLWAFLLESGATEDELCWFADNPCPPDVMGINYYPTSDRYIDEDMDRYPPHLISQCFQRRQFSDIEAVRVLDIAPGGFEERLLEAWNRYHLPLAITEAHLGCTREEQLRWLAWAWQGAKNAREAGADVRAVTAWSLLGAYNWNNLVTRDENFYEPGVFDLRGPQPRPTALASLIRDLANDEEHTHPALHQQGWWQRSDRLIYPPKASSSYLFDSKSLAQPSNRDKSARPLLILGSTGTLGSAFALECDIRALPYCAVSRCDVDISDSMALETLLEETRPWAVINATGYVRIDDAEAEEEMCFRVNTEGANRLAVACAHQGIKLMCFSSDMVFDGSHNSPYVESHATSPLNAYGRSKAEMEKRVLEVLPSALVVRTSAFFGPHEERNFVTQTLRSLISGEQVYASDKHQVSPTYVPHLVVAALDLLVDGESGLWHLANNGVVSWADLALLAAKSCGINGVERILRRSEANNLGIAQRPIFSALGTERGQILPPLDEALHCYGCATRW